MTSDTAPLVWVIMSSDRTVRATSLLHSRQPIRAPPCTREREHWRCCRTTNSARFSWLRSRLRRRPWSTRSVAARTMGELRVAHRPGAQGRTLGPEEEAAAPVGDEWMNDAERQEFHPHFQRALSFATSLHASQTRKGTDIPYTSHLLAVAGLVLECGGGRDEAIAGLLHDSIEDCGPKYPGGVTALRERLESEFGPTVLRDRRGLHGCRYSSETSVPGTQGTLHCPHQIYVTGRATRVMRGQATQRAGHRR